MASALYRSYKQSCLEGTAEDASSETLFKSLLIDVADYTVDSATHDFLNDVAAGAREEGPVTLTSTTTNSPEGGVFDAANITHVAAAGDPCEAIIIYSEGGGTDATRPLVAYIDGFSVTLNGGDVNVNWDNGTNRIFKL
jgi:hypothetical protein